MAVISLLLFLLSFLLHSQCLLSVNPHQSTPQQLLQVNNSPSSLLPPSLSYISSSGDDSNENTGNDLTPQESSGGGEDIIILIAPPTPDTPTVFIVNLSQVLINWEYPTTTPTQYIVQCRSYDFGDSNYHNITSGLLSSTHFYYSQMKVSSYYIFRIIAYQGRVASSPSYGSQLFVNGESAPSGPPVDLSISDVTNTSLVLMWSTPKPVIDRSYSYHIYKGNSPNDLSEVDTLVSGDQKYTFKHLNPNTTYYFAVQADISGIRSILSVPISQTTNPIGTIYPLSFNVTPSITTATVTWTPPHITVNDVLQQYTVLYLPRALVGGSLQDTSKFNRTVFPNNATSGHVVGLQEGVVYVFMIGYRIDNTDSPLSRPLLVQMKTSVVCTGCVGVSSLSLVLKWKHNQVNRQATFMVSSPTCTNTTLTTFNTSISLTLPADHPWTHCLYSIALRTPYATYGPPVTCPSDQCNTLIDRPFHYPTNFTGKALSSHSLLLTWMPLPSDQWNAPYLTDYVLFCTTTNYNKNNNNNNNQESDGCGKRFLSVSGNKSSLLVDNLSPFTTYSFIVAAKNAAGYGPSSNTIYTTTMEDVPTGPPLSVILSAAGGSHLYINWSPPLAGERNGPITHYVIYYENNSTNSIMTHSAITYNETSIVLNELQYGSMYSVWVQAWNSIGGGPNSSEMYYSTLNYIQPEIINFTAIESLSNSSSNQKCFPFLLSWIFNIDATNTNSSIASLLQRNLTYTLTPITGTTGLQGWREIQLVDGVHSVVMDSNFLNPNTNYTLRLSALFQLDNGSVVSTSKTLQILTPNCSGVTTVLVKAVAIVTSTVMVVLMVCVLVCCCSCWMKKRRSKRHSSPTSNIYPRHAVLGQALQPFPPSQPNDYYLPHRREERGDGESSHSGLDSEEEGSSFIHNPDSSETVSDQNDESSSYDEDVPLISQHELISPSFSLPPPLQGVASFRPSFQSSGSPLHTLSYHSSSGHSPTSVPLPYSPPHSDGYIVVEESHHPYCGFAVPPGGFSDDGRLGPDGHNSSLSLDSLTDSISSAPEIL